jgi:hypothetical protein
MADSQLQGRRILIVGAGAVGQVYGAHMHEGGADVSVYVKPKYVEAASAGFPLHRIGLLGGVAHRRWEGFAVYSEIDALREQAWDQVWLTVSSDALQGEWLAELAAATGTATLVSQHSVPEDGARVAAAAGADERIVRGPIPLISYGTSLHAEDTWGEGIRYLLPPGSQGFSGASDERVQAVVGALRAGGMSAKSVGDAGADYELGGALFLPFMASLELCDWSFRAARSSAEVRLGIEAGRECVARAAASHGRTAPLWSRLWSPSIVSLLLAIAPGIMPVPIEAFFRYHFTKVGLQTELMLEEHTRAGAAEGRPMAAAKDLLGRLRQRRAGDAGRADPLSATV